MNIQTKYCALCPDELTENNKTEEHIIPNSIGGWPKVEYFICESCNSRKGKYWDSEIYAQFNWIVAMIGILRDRGSQSKELVTTMSGVDYHILPDGTMVPARFEFSRQTDGEDVKISFVARNDKEAREKITELHKKYPQIDIEEAIKNAKIKTRRLQEPIQINRSIGGALAGRSIVCTALAYAFSQGVNPHSCENIQQFLHDPTAPNTGYGFFYLRDIVLKRPKDKLFLCVSIHGSKKAKRLLAYVEYFGLGRWLVVLSNEYQGDSFTSTYAVDPTDQEPIDLNIDWSISTNMIDKTASGYGMLDKNYRRAEAHTIQLIHVLSAKRLLEKKMASVSEALLSKHGVGMDENLSPEKGKVIANEYIDLMLKEVDDLLLDGINGKVR